LRPVVVPFFISHLGCPHRCVFCDQEKIAGSPGVLPDRREILQKIEQYRESAPDRELEVAFYGGTFTALPKADQELLLGALQPPLQSGTVSSIRLSTRPDAVDAGVAAFLWSMGVRTVELGVQSMDEEVLTLSQRGHTVPEVERAVVALREAGLSVGIQLMPGLPGDTYERSLESLDRVLALSPDFLRIYPTLVISGTDLAELYTTGKYQPQTLDQAVALCKRMLLRCRRGGVPVIRLGLQPTAELESPGTLLAGPYHPAFGQLVESELYYDLARGMVATLPRGTRVALAVSPGRTSDFVGQKRRNVMRLREELEVEVAAVVEDAALGLGEIALSWDDGELRDDVLSLRY
jgi:histone acetyltransferase (RNA polymerase elongator complex component)